MNGSKKCFAQVIGGFNTRLVIPVYQRNYDWKPENCARLFDDLIEMVKDGRDEHFFGSIVSQTPHGERVIIDGQQRITTVFLLFAAIAKQLKDGVVTSENPHRADMIERGYLVDEWARDEQKLRLKLIKSDSAALEAVLADACPQDPSLPAPELVMCSWVASAVNGLTYALIGRLEAVIASRRPYSVRNLAAIATPCPYAASRRATSSMRMASPCLAAATLASMSTPIAAM